MSLLKDKLPVAVLFGGPSGEHDVSLASGKNIALALQESGFPILCVGIEKKEDNPQWREIPMEDLAKTTLDNPIDISALGSPIAPKDLAQKVKCAFPICHGPFGEDGELQSQLQNLKLPYVGTEPLGCSLSLDKAKTKEVIAQVPLAQTPFLVTTDPKFSFEEATAKLQLPLFVKPCAMGSSVGISRVTKVEEWQKAITLAFQHDNTIVIEQGLEGRELECALLETEQGLQVSGIAEIVSHHDFYSYEAKYLDPKGAALIYPAKISEENKGKIQEAAKQAFRALKCRDYARADFFLTAKGEVIFNEINTHPGFTKISQFPSLCKHMGMSYGDLVSGMVLRAVRY